MHVLVLSAHSCSIDRRIIAQANSLQHAGYNVEIVSVPIRSDFTKIIHPEVKIFYDTPTQHSSAKVKLKKTIAKTIGKTLSEKIRFFQRKKYNNSNYNFFINFPYEKKYDVIHAHDLDTLPAAITIKEKFFPHAKIIYDSHEFYAEQFPDLTEREYWHSIEESCLQKVDHIITVNPSIARLFKDFYMNCPPIDVVYNSYGLKKDNEKLSKEDFIKFSGIYNDLPIVIFQGGLTKERNLENLFRAFAQLKSKANLLIIGDGPLLPQLTALKASLKLDNVFLKGWVDQHFLSSVLPHISFGIIPYSLKSLLNNLYCTPNKLFEYIAHRVPICANFLPEVVAIVSGYNIGNVYQLTTANKIAQGIEDFLTHFSKIPLINFDEADAAFSWQVQEQKLLQVYDGLS